MRIAAVDPYIISEEDVEAAKERFWKYATPVPHAGCWVWTGPDRNRGYGCLRVRGRIVPAHRISWTMFNGPIPRFRFVLHKCDTTACVNPDHLEIGTKAKNARDAVRRGRMTPPASGEKHWCAKLAAEDVDRILRSDESDETLAEKYGVHPLTINNARSGKTWRRRYNAMLAERGAA